MLVYYTPPPHRFNEVERGVYWYHLVRLSVCPSVDRIVSALYRQQYSSDPFNICTSYQATKIWNFGDFFKFVALTFSSFWLGIQYDSMVWVIMRRRGYPQNAGVLIFNWTIRNKFQWNFNQNIFFLSRKCIWKYRLRNRGHVVQGEIYLSQPPITGPTHPLSATLDCPTHDHILCFIWFIMA